MSLRRRVAGRSKPFDQLLQEHRDAKEALLQAKLLNEPKKSTGATPAESPHKSKYGNVFDWPSVLNLL